MSPSAVQKYRGMPTNVPLIELGGPGGAGVAPGAVCEPAANGEAPGSGRATISARLFLTDPVGVKKPLS